MIHFLPDMDPLWAKKCQITFENVEELKKFAVEHRNQFCRFIGNACKFTLNDVEIKDYTDLFLTNGWNHRCTVFVGGRKIGFCGK